MALCDSRIENYIRNIHFDELNTMEPNRRAARKFRLALETLTLTLKTEKSGEPDELFGWFSFDTTGIDGALLSRRAFDDEKPDGELSEILSRPALCGSRINVDRGHTLVDYEALLSRGLDAYAADIRAELETCGDPENHVLRAMADSLSAAAGFTARLVAHIDSLREGGELTEKDRARLEAIRASLSRVPAGPAESFRDALQSVWLVHFLTPLADNAWYSISLGRFDFFMYPYYLRSRAAGMTIDEAKALLLNFWRLLNSYADGACLLNVGPEYNELSYLVIECQKEFGLPAPILGARVASETKDEVWKALIDEKLFSMGQPTFYGEEPCIAALLEKGVPQEDAAGFSNNSCMGISLPGREFNSMWGCVLSIQALLEAALNGGRLLDGRAGLNVPDIGEVTSLDELYDAFARCAKYCLGELCLPAYEARAVYSERCEPDPFVSLLTKDCIRRRCDRISGADYHNITVECMGMINASDAICAIDRLVFREGRYTLADFNAAVRANYEGHDQLRRDIMACPKFGENGAADEYAVRIAETLAEIIISFSHDRMYYSPSLHTLDANVGDGAAWHAGYDGRLAGTPFAKNAGCANEARKPDPTSLVLSSSKLPQSSFFGGQPLDVSFPPGSINTDREKIAALIKVYFARGGLQFQVNALSPAVLREAYEHPERHPGLVVRIGGYSVAFARLGERSKLELIDRVEREGSI